MGVALSTPAHFEMEIQRAQVLQYDLPKSYVRLPDLQQKRMGNAHSIGIPVATHEIYPAALVGVDNTEHSGDESPRLFAEARDATARLRGRGAVVREERAHFLSDDFGGGVRKLFEDEADLKHDPRFKLYPEWIQQQVAAGGRGGAGSGGGGDPTGGERQDGAGRHARGRSHRRGTDTRTGSICTAS